MTQVLSGLVYLHDQGVIHRDIKGANILTTKEGLVKLADFGVATKSNLSESSVVGTPYWMAPEVIELTGATTASDIWSLGCTVIELLDGKPPYHKLQPMPALFRIVNDDHPPLPEGASPAVRDFLMQCFQKDPNLRVSAKKLLKHPWIVNAKKTDSVVSEKPTKYEQAVQSVQQWNEALKSPDHDSLRLSRGPRPTSFGPIPSRKDALQLSTPAPLKGGLNISKTRPNTEAFRSPDLDSNDNWDDDFASSISPSALQLPHLKPHDNFDGLLSAEKLKQFATFDSLQDQVSDDEVEWETVRCIKPPDIFIQGSDEEKEFTARSPVHLMQADPLETVRPFTPQKTKTKDGKPVPPNTGSLQQVSHQKKQSSSSSVNRITTTPTPKNKLVSLRRPSYFFREDSVENYDDLLSAEADDAAFQRKLEALKLEEEKSFSPKLFHPSDLQSTPKANHGTRRGGSLRNRYPTPEERHREGLTRTRSEVEIQKYAEDDDEDPEAFLGKDVELPVADSDSGSERSTLIMLNSKLANSWLGDEEDEDDPFAQLEEGFDEVDMEQNVARDRAARLVTLVEGLVGSLKTNQPPDVLSEVSEQLMQVLVESPEMKDTIITSHGMLPILEILDTCERRDVVLRLLKIVNMIIFENQEIQENLCFVGGIPIITKFAHKKYTSEIRLEAAAFVRQMYQTSLLTLQMFISCGGLNVLVEFLEEDLDEERDLVLIGVNGVWNVFELPVSRKVQYVICGSPNSKKKGPTPKNDFCRIFARSSILYPLSLVLSRVLDEKSDLAELIEGRIVNIFLLFSQAENHVKELVADRMILKRVLKDLRRMSPNHQITMLKFVKNLSMLATTHDSLQNSGAIEALTDLLSASIDSVGFREISNQVLNIMYNLCRLSKTRQEDAALNGIIPLLQKIVKTERPLKEFALPILCDMAHSGKICRKILWQNKGLQFYISLLADKYWQVTALDAIFIWLQEETARVEQFLLTSTFSTALVSCFTNPDVSPDAFENFLDPLQKLLRLSPPIASTLAHPDLFSRTATKLNAKKPVVRLNLLRVIRSICDACEEQGGASLIRTYGLYETIERLAELDQAVLVRNLSAEMIKACELSSRRSMESTLSRVVGGRRTSSSSSAMTPPPLMHTQSMPAPTPPHLRSAASSISQSSSLLDGANGIFDSSRSSRLGNINGTSATPSASSSSSSLFRPRSRDHDAAVNGAFSNGSAASSTKSRLPRGSGQGRLTRLSLASQRKEENVTPMQTPGSTLSGASAAAGTRNTGTGSGGVLAAARRRRQTSSETSSSRFAS